MGVAAYFAVTAIIYTFCWPVALYGGFIFLAVIEQFGIKPQMEYAAPFVMFCMWMAHLISLGVYRFVTRWENRVAPEV